MKPGISILLPDLRAGGAERMRIHMAREWVRRGIEVEFVLREARGELLKEVPSSVEVVSLGAKRVRGTFWPLVRHLRARQPGSLLASMWPMTVLSPLAAKAAGYKGRVVVSEHNNLVAAYANRGALHHLKMRATMRLGYPLASAVVAVSAGVAVSLAQLSGRPISRIDVIHNPACTGINGSLRGRPAEMPEGLPVVLAVCSLKEQKRLDLLLAAFASMQRSLKATLCVLGDGPIRSRLIEQADELGIRDCVRFLGYRADTAAWFAHADLFVLSSDYEGFGNVIVESLEQGTPVVSTDCPSGPREILGDGKYGSLVPVGDVDALALAMERAISRDHDGNALKRRAREFSVERAADAYLDLLLPDWRAA